ncbi:MAG: hypothetical protein V5A33_02920 [Halobacteriales archaeon]
MVADDRPHEPDEPFSEPDPEADLPDAETELVSVPEAPRPPEPLPESEVPDDLLRTFWATVLFVNVAVLGLVVGPIAILALSDPRVGTALLAVGLVATVGAVGQYRAAQRARGKR